MAIRFALAQLSIGVFSLHGHFVFCQPADTSFLTYLNLIFYLLSRRVLVSTKFYCVTLWSVCHLKLLKNVCHIKHR